MTEAHSRSPRGPRNALSGLPGHHPNHTPLLTPVASPGGPARVDAIVVPTIRPTPTLDSAVRLAQRVGCVLLVLCSQRADRESTVAAARRRGVTAYAVDVHDAPALPAFATSTEFGDLPRRGRNPDLSLKRNLGLAIARLVGWRRIAFLDDDIRRVRADDLAVAAAQVDDYTAVGLHNVGFPDNSVVCHAYRDTGGLDQATFVGGGALVVPADRTTSFFPDIYNEDWFFLLEGDRLGRVATTGRVWQRAYDPYDSPGRAYAQEFGDCLAEGMFALLDDGRRVSDADLDYWMDYLAERALLIEEVLDRVADSDGPRDRMTASLHAARKSLETFTPQHCVDYLSAWRRDGVRWSAFLAGLPGGHTVTAALDRLGLRDRSAA